MTLADLFNSPTALEFEGVTFQLRQPTIAEEGMYTAWLKQLAYDEIERRTYQDAAQQAADRAAMNRECVAGVYDFGNEVCVAKLATKDGLAKLLFIICRDQGLTEVTAKRLVELERRKVIAELSAKVVDDPKALALLLQGLGFPPDFLMPGGTSSSPSVTLPSSTPSTTSEALPGTSSPPCTKSTAGLMDIPG